MRPRRYKVVQEGRHSPDGASSNNATSEYHVLYEDAVRTAFERNNVWPVITRCLQECMRRDKANYEDLLLRWLAVRRDYPYDNTAEPPMPPGLDLSALRADTIAEFNRTSP